MLRWFERKSIELTVLFKLELVLPSTESGLGFSSSSPHNTLRQNNQVERGWSGGAMMLGKLPVPGRPTILITVGQGPTALAVGAGGGCLDIFTLICLFFPLSPSLWETARYRLKYCLKGPLNPKTTNQPTKWKNCDSKS